MELAAVASFAILVVGWALAPDRPRPARVVGPALPAEPSPEAQPAAA